MKHPKASKAIEEVMAHLKTSKSAFAKDTGVPRQIIHDYINGDRPISSLNASRIVEAFPQFNYTYLLRGEGSLLATPGQKITMENIAADPLGISLVLLDHVITIRKELAEIKQMLNNQTK